MKLSLHTAANGHLSLEFGDYGSALWQAVSRYLEVDLGFRRVGETVAGIDEGIRQSFEFDGMSISAGWDNWSGDYLLANSQTGDELLRTIFSRFEPNSLFDTDATRRST